MDEVSLARAVFPRGLSQPDTGFRFSVDALLLAAFAGNRAVRGRVLDLGAGCGVVGLAVALNHPDFMLLSLDRNPDMLRHVHRNASRLGLGGRCLQLRADVTEPGGLRPEVADVVVCNPPYRDPGSGRINPDEGRAGARFEQRGGLEDFVRAAAWSVRNRGTCVFVQLAERLDDLLGLLLTHRLRPKELLCIHPRPDQPARLVLVRAIKNGGSGLGVLPPLFLHEGWGEQTRLSPAALEFCPWLICNS